MSRRVVTFVNSGGRIRGKNFAFSSPSFARASASQEGGGESGVFKGEENHMSEKKRRDVETEGRYLSDDL